MYELTYALIIIHNESYACENICGKSTLDWIKDTVSTVLEKNRVLSSQDFNFGALSKSGMTFLIINGIFPLLKATTLTNILEFHKLKNSSLTQASESKIIVVQSDQLREDMNIDAIVKNSKSVSQFDCDGTELSTNLNLVRKLINQNLTEKIIANNVTVLMPDSFYADCFVEVGKGTIIEPNVMLIGRTVIGENCLIGSNTKIIDCAIGNNTSIECSFLKGSKVGEFCNIGPFAHLRPGSHLGDRVKVGDFVEIKNSVIGDCSKASHLTYIGDADVGSGVNFGCGSIVVNFDGKMKHRSIIKNDAFIGCNTNLVSPVKVENSAYVAAGSTVTKDVPAFALAIARQKQTNIKDWVLNWLRR